MANEEQLSILKQGVEVWNEWRKVNRATEVDLSMAKLSHADLKGADLRGTDLSMAKLNYADLKGADLSEAHLIAAELSFADLSKADLREADLSEADLSGANLRAADLKRANLNAAYLSEANLNGADLIGSKFSEAKVAATIFADLDLSKAIALEDVDHRGPSTIGIDATAKSKGKIPEAFLRGCGLSDWEIEEVKLYNPDLSNEEINRILYKMYDLRASQALQISPLFISYSQMDDKFVDKVQGKLNERGIRYWRDIHDATSGRLEKIIDRAMRLNPTVLLILSESSTKSDWVEHEVKEARKLEKEMGRDVLCPVALDDSWKTSPWPKRIVEQIMEYNILDFSAWEDDVKFDGMFRKLIDGLELFYKG